MLGFFPAIGRAHELRQRTLLDLNDDGDREAARRFLARRLAAQAPVSSPEVERSYRRKDGGLLWVYEALGLVRDAQGRSVRSVRQVAPGQRLDIELADGHVAARTEEGGKAVEGQAQPRAPARRGEPARTKGKAGSPDDQGSLF